VKYPFNTPFTPSEYSIEFPEADIVNEVMVDRFADKVNFLFVKRMAAFGQTRRA